MSNIFTTMVPIFSIVFLGVLSKRVGFITLEFFEPANRLVFYIGIPAMIFNSTYCSPFIHQINFIVIYISLFSIMLVFFFCRLISGIIHIPTTLVGSISQCSIHGNLGYIGLAVAFYYLGSEGLAQSSIITAFIMIFQNFLSIVGFQIQGRIRIKNIFSISLISRLIVNPVIIAAILGLMFSLSELILPKSIGNILDILSGFALPLALLIIGASLSIREIKKWLLVVFMVCLSKLIFLPLVALILFRYYGVHSDGYMPALILLSSPTATISCVMAQELGGDVGFSSAAVSLSTLLSILTISFWITLGNV